MLETAVRANPEILNGEEQAGASGIQHAARITSVAAAMNHCLEEMTPESGTAEQAAYCRLLFDLYHNASRQELKWRESIPDGLLPETGEGSVPDAMQKIREMHQERLHTFNRGLPTTLGRAFDKASPEIIKQAQGILVEPIGFRVGVLSGPESEWIHGIGSTRYFYSHVAYWHQGRRRVHGVNDPHPADFPRELVMQQTKATMRIEHPDPELQQTIRRAAQEKHIFAAHGGHAVSPEAMQQFIRTAEPLMPSRSALQDLIDMSVEFHPGLTGALAGMGGMNLPVISRRRAQQVIRAARQAGLDDFQLMRIAEAMDWCDPQALGIEEPEYTSTTIERVLQAAAQAGFDEGATQEMRDWFEIEAQAE